MCVLAPAQQGGPRAFLLAVCRQCVSSTAVFHSPPVPVIQTRGFPFGLKFEKSPLCLRSVHPCVHLKPRVPLLIFRWYHFNSTIAFSVTPPPEQGFPVFLSQDPGWMIFTCVRLALPGGVEPQTFGSRKALQLCVTATVRWYVSCVLCGLC